MMDHTAQDVYRQSLGISSHQVVRDLIWCIVSPVLISHENQLYGGRSVTQRWCDEHLQRFMPHLVQLAKDPTPLEAWCSSRPNQRLGRYFETLVSYWLHHSPEITSVGQSLQVRQGHQTVGEFDFLFYDQKMKQRYHLEVAVKFYLRLGLGDKLSDYVGPSGIDRLDRKVHLLFAKQLHLGSTEPGAQMLERLHGQSSCSSLAFVKGMIFDPVNKETACHLTLAPEISRYCLRGTWMTQSQLPQSLPLTAPYRWCPVTRLRWLSPVMTEDEGATQPAEVLPLRVEQHFAISSDPLMLAVLEYHPMTHMWVENRRVIALKEYPSLPMDASREAATT